MKFFAAKSLPIHRTMRLYGSSCPKVSGVSLDTTTLQVTAIDASALLDPLLFCKTSSKLSHSHGVNRGISGTDAACRLLRGKREFVETARDLQTPAIVVGHGVPPKLFQHCVDMAHSMLRDYGDDVVACSFHQHGNGNALPPAVRIRTGDVNSTVRRWPPPTNHGCVDWAHHLTLYANVMERFARNLGVVFHGGASHQAAGREGCGMREPEKSPASYPSILRRAVDIQRGMHYDLRNTHGTSAAEPLPILEITNDPKHGQHISIQLEGCPLPNDDFPGGPGTAVSLRFRATFWNGR